MSNIHNNVEPGPSPGDQSTHSASISIAKKNDLYRTHSRHLFHGARSAWFKIGENVPQTLEKVEQLGVSYFTFSVKVVSLHTWN